MYKDTVVRENATSLKTWKKGSVDAAERAKGSTTVHQGRETRAVRLHWGL